jgi:uncharacterized protein
MHSRWRGLGIFWLAVLLLLGAAGGALQYLGPPQTMDGASVGGEAPPHALAEGAAGGITAAKGPGPAAHTGPSSAPDKPPPLVVERFVGPRPDQPGRELPGPITDPDPALLEASPTGGSDMLPKIAPDGRLPMQVYAAGFDRSTRRTKIGVLVAGIGLSEGDSLNAIKNLPGGISLAVSPYGMSFDRLLAASRLAQHEYLLSIPMEPQGFPLSDPGRQALMTNVGRSDNMKRLLWSMSRFGGYVGATGALGDMRGERFVGLSDQMEPILSEIAHRGLLYVDSRVNQSQLPLVWGRGIDLVLDDPVTANAIDSRLADLETIAREKGSALGLVGAPRPVTVERLQLWSSQLADRGFVLTPISAMVSPPPKDSPQ